MKPKKPKWNQKREKGPQLEPQGHQTGAKRVQRGAKSGPKDPNWSHKGAKMSPKGSKGAQKGPKSEPKINQNAPKSRFSEQVENTEHNCWVSAIDITFFTFFWYENSKNDKGIYW